MNSGQSVHRGLHRGRRGVGYRVMFQVMKPERWVGRRRCGEDLDVLVGREEMLEMQEEGVM